MVNWVEYLGYAASILIGASMFMKDMLRLRFVNTIGAILFVIYSMFIKAYPVAIVNFTIIFVNIYYLYIIIKDNDK